MSSALPPTSNDDGNYKEMNYFVKLDAQDKLQNSIVLLVTMRIFTDEKHQFAIV